MTHTEYVRRMRHLLRDHEKLPRRAAVGFLRLSKAAQAGAKSAMSEWHVEQALGFAAASFEAAGDRRRSESVERDIVQMHRSQMKYHRSALAYSLARLALACLRSGKKKEGVKLGFEALGYFGRQNEAPAVLQDLVVELRGYGLTKKA